MATYVTVQDVTDRYEGTADPDRVQVLIDDAERILLRRIPTLAAALTAGDVDQDDVRYAVAHAVMRVLRNPEGYTSEAGGDYSYSRGAAAAQHAGRLVFLEDELAPLLPDRAGTAWPGTVRTPLPPDRAGSWAGP